MLTSRVVLLLALLLVAAVPAQAESDGACEADCSADADCTADCSAEKRCDDECRTERAAEKERSQNETQEAETSGDDGFASSADSEICRLLDPTDLTNPGVDPDGCIQRIIFSILRP